MKEEIYTIRDKIGIGIMIGSVLMFWAFFGLIFITVSPWCLIGMIVSGLCWLLGRGMSRIN